MNPLDLRKLQNFVRIVDLGSVTKAASVLSLAQSALSKQIRELELEFGDRLFHRTGRGVVPTEFAKQLLPRIRTLLLEAEQLAEDIKAHRGSPNGHVRLALLTSISTILLTPLLSRINDRYPGIQVHVLEGLAEDVEEWLTSGRADLGILYGDRRTASPTDEHLMSAELYLISAWEDPIGGEETFSLKGVSELPLILPALPNLWRRSIERACADHHIALHVPFELDAIQTIKNLVATKHRYSILPLHAVLREVNEGVLKVSRIVEPTITREVFLSLSTQRPHSRASSEVAAAIRKVLIELVRSGELPGRV